MEMVVPSHGVPTKSNSIALRRQKDHKFEVNLTGLQSNFKVIQNDPASSPLPPKKKKNSAWGRMFYILAGGCGLLFLVPYSSGQLSTAPKTDF
jgi:hypothetical protein